MSQATVLTDKFDRALLYATHVHGGQVRKKTKVPYVAHLLAVAATVLEYGGDEDLAIAGLLHDAVEDQGGEARLNDIRNRFGVKVAGIVESCSGSTADTAKGEKKADWQTRKESYLGHLQKVDQDTLLVSLSDKDTTLGLFFVTSESMRLALSYGRGSTNPGNVPSGITVSLQKLLGSACRKRRRPVNWRVSWATSLKH